MHVRGKDKYGHFVMFGDFRSAMPDAKTAHETAAAPDLLLVAEKLLWWFPDLPEILGGQMTDEAKYLLSAARTAIANTKGS